MKIFIFLFLLSCQFNKNLSQKECEDLSFKSYKGFPKALNDFNRYCGDHNIIYTKEYCQSALKELVLHGDSSVLKDKYGDRILECFSEKEKEKFLKKQSP